MEEGKSGMEHGSRETRRISPYWWGLGTGIALALVVIGLGMLIFRPTIILGNTQYENGMSSQQMTGLLNKANRIINTIEEQYILEDLSVDDLIEGMYEGLMDVLDDQYAEYYTAEEYAEIKINTEGSYGGVGISVAGQDIVAVYEGSPAAAAGIQPGDRLMAVEGESISGMSTEELRERISGQIGEIRNLTLYRPSDDSTYDVAVTLAEVEIPTVFWHEIEDGIMYLQITSFDTVTEEQFDEAWEQMMASGMKGLILDLRNNLGGSLNAVLAVAEHLVPEGLIAYTENKQGERQEFYAEGEGIQVPMTVLVNEYSASASELLCGALKERDVATVVGTTTFGKGIVQTTWSMSDGTAYKMTTAKYYTPNGNNIHGTGIEPDILIDLTEEQKQMSEIPEEEDMQLQTALEVIRTDIGA